MSPALLCAAILSVFPAEPDRAEMMCRHARHIIETSDRYGQDPAVVVALVWRESKFNHLAVNPRSGCCGLAQTNPAFVGETCKELQVPAVSLMAAARSLHYWRVRRGYRDIGKALQCYASGNKCRHAPYAAEVRANAGKIRRYARRPTPNIRVMKVLDDVLF